MFNRLKSTAKSTLIYSIGSVGIKFIGLILLPIYTDKLTTEQYGMWSLLEITSQVLLMVFGLRLSTAMLRFYASAEDDIGRSRIVFPAFLVSFISVVIFNAAGIPFASGLSVLFFDTDAFSTYFVLLFIWTSTEVFNRLILDFIRIKEKPLLYITVTMSKFTMVLLVIIYLVVKQNMGIEGIILGQLIGSAFVLLVAMPMMLKAFRWEVDVSLFREMIKYGIPLIFSGISTFILAVGDRFLIKIFLDYHEVGVYSLSYKLSNVIKIVFIQAFQLGFLPIVFNMFDKPDSKRFFSKIFTYYSFMIFWVGLALALFSKEVVHLLASSPDYYEASLYMPYLILAVSLFGIQNFFLIGMHYARKTQFIAYITLGVLAINIGMNVLLIPRIGLMGAAISNISSGAMMVVLNYFQSQRFLRIPFELAKVFIILLLSVGLFLLSTLVNGEALIIRIAVKGAMLISFPALLYLLGFYEAVELERIRGAWRKWRNPLRWYRNFFGDPD